ncbi:MAG: hypothetical protein OXG35_21410 [Acidobacteria bacterium]|nr:hypothetical protein [Acidobacteriota bacterium]
MRKTLCLATLWVATLLLWSSPPTSAWATPDWPDPAPPGETATADDTNQNLLTMTATPEGGPTEAAGDATPLDQMLRSSRAEAPPPEADVGDRNAMTSNIMKREHRHGPGHRATDSTGKPQQPAYANTPMRTQHRSDGAGSGDRRGVEHPTLSTAGGTSEAHSHDQEAPGMSRRT